MRPQGCAYGTGIKRVNVLACYSLLLSSCGQLACERVGGTPMLEYQLYFGRTSVADETWADFVAGVVTKNLPDGFTVLNGEGQWMNPTSDRISHERTTIIIVAVPDTAASATAIAAIKNAAIQRFHQQSVGTVIHPVCGAF